MKKKVKMQVLLMERAEKWREKCLTFIIFKRNL